MRNPDSVKIHIHPGARFKGGTELGDMSYLYLGGNVREVGYDYDDSFASATDAAVADEEAAHTTQKQADGDRSHVVAHADNVLFTPDKNRIGTFTFPAPKRRRDMDAMAAPPFAAELLLRVGRERRLDQRCGQRRERYALGFLRVSPCKQAASFCEVKADDDVDARRGAARLVTDLF